MRINAEGHPSQDGKFALPLSIGELTEANMNLPARRQRDALIAKKIMKLPNVRMLKVGTPFGGLGYYKPLEEDDWYFDDPQVPEDDQGSERRCRVPFYLTDTIAALGILHKLCGDHMKCGDLSGAYFEIRGPRGYLVTIYTPSRDFSATGGSLASAIRRVALLIIGIQEPIGG